MRGGTPLLTPLLGTDIVVDGPIIIGFAATTGDLAAVSTWFKGRLKVSQNTPAEIREAWSNSIPGAELDADPYVISVSNTGDPPDIQAELAKQWRGLSRTWRRDAMTEVRVRGLATGFVTAMHPKLPLLTHDPQAWQAAAPNGVPRRVRIGGMVEVVLIGCKLHAITPDAAWDLYTRTSATIAGPQTQVASLAA